MRKRWIHEVFKAVQKFKADTEEGTVWVSMVRRYPLFLCPILNRMYYISHQRPSILQTGCLQLALAPLHALHLKVTFEYAAPRRMLPLEAKNFISSMTERRSEGTQYGPYGCEQRECCQWHV